MEKEAGARVGGRSSITQPRPASWITLEPAGSAEARSHDDQRWNDAAAWRPCTLYNRYRRPVRFKLMKQAWCVRLKLKSTASGTAAMQSGAWGYLSRPLDWTHCPGRGTVHLRPAYLSCPVRQCASTFSVACLERGGAVPQLISLRRGAHHQCHATSSRRLHSCWIHSKNVLAMRVWT